MNNEMLCFSIFRDKKALNTKHTQEYVFDLKENSSLFFTVFFRKRLEASVS